MKNTKRPELILNLTGITGGLRQLFSTSVQILLFSLGYRWPVMGEQVAHTNHDMLRICSQIISPDIIMWDDGVIRTSGEAIVFDAQTQFSAFIEHAKRGLVERQTIEGVELAITPYGITLDATKLLNRVSEQAKTAQSEIFGR